MLKEIIFLYGQSTRRRSEISDLQCEVEKKSSLQVIFGKNSKEENGHNLR